MRVITETNLANLKTWSEATNTKQRIIDEGKEKEFEALIEELHPDGIEDGTLNDILWFESDWVYEQLGISEEEEEEEE